MYYNIGLTNSFDDLTIGIESMIGHEYNPTKDLHVTVFYGENPSSEMEKFLAENIGRTFKFDVEAIGFSAGTVALLVKPLDEDFMTCSTIPHVTLGVKAGHKPVESNEIVSWNRISNPNILVGKLQRVH